MRLSCILAVAQNGVIGNQGQLPWHLPSDLQLFKKVTLGKPVLMGRKTWESLPRRPLPGRLNIVITRQNQSMFPEALVATCLQDALTKAEDFCNQNTAEEALIIGGAALFKEAFQSGEISTVYLTEIPLSPPGDTFFPIESLKNWQIVHQEFHARQENDDTSFVWKILKK